MQRVNVGAYQALQSPNQHIPRFPLPSKCCTIDICVRERSCDLEVIMTSKADVCTGEHINIPLAFFFRSSDSESEC